MRQWSHMHDLVGQRVEVPRHTWKLPARAPMPVPRHPPIAALDASGLRVDVGEVLVETDRAAPLLVGGLRTRAVLVRGPARCSLTTLTPMFTLMSTTRRGGRRHRQLIVRVVPRIFRPRRNKPTPRPKHAAHRRTKQQRHQTSLQHNANSSGMIGPPGRCTRSAHSRRGIGRLRHGAVTRAALLSLRIRRRCLLDRVHWRSANLLVCSYNCP